MLNTRTTIVGGVAWLVAFWLLSKAQLVLILDSATWEKYCVDRLAEFLSVSQGGLASYTVYWLCLFILVLFPAFITVLALRKIFVSVSEKKRQVDSDEKP